MFPLVEIYTTNWPPQWGFTEATSQKEKALCSSLRIDVDPHDFQHPSIELEPQPGISVSHFIN